MTLCVNSSPPGLAYKYTNFHTQAITPIQSLSQWQIGFCLILIYACLVTILIVSNIYLDIFKISVVGHLFYISRETFEECLIYPDCL